MKKVTKQEQRDYLRMRLSTDRGWAKAALLKIYDNQTDDEQDAEHTMEMNGIGFTGVDGHILSSFSEQLIKRGSLSERQMEILMKKMKKYWKQILSISDEDKINELVIKNR